MLCQAVSRHGAINKAFLNTNFNIRNNFRMGIFIGKSHIKQVFLTGVCKLLTD